MSRSASTRLRVLALNSDAARSTDGRWIGDPTETALVEAAEQAGLDVDAVRAARPTARRIAI